MNNLLKLMCIGVMFSGMALAGDEVDGQPLVYDSGSSSDDAISLSDRGRKGPLTLDK